MFLLWCIDWDESLYANQIYMYFCIKSSIGTRGGWLAVQVLEPHDALPPVPVLVLLFVALWFILRGYLFHVLHCVILFLCFSVLLALRLPRLGKIEQILLLFVRLFDLCLFGFVGFLFLVGLGRAAVGDCGTSWTFLLPFFVRANNLFAYLHIQCNV